jgi:mRNA interferase MazF
MLVALSGDYGKPRPAVVVQAVAFARLPSITVLPLTSDLQAEPLLRIGVQPNRTNGLQKSSQIMVDKISTVSRGRLGPRLGCLAADDLQLVDRALAVFLGIASHSIAERG